MAGFCSNAAYVKGKRIRTHREWCRRWETSRRWRWRLHCRAAGRCRCTPSRWRRSHCTCHDPELWSVTARPANPHHPPTHTHRGGNTPHTEYLHVKLNKVAILFKIKQKIGLTSNLNHSEFHWGFSDFGHTSVLKVMFPNFTCGTQWHQCWKTASMNMNMHDMQIRNASTWPAPSSEHLHIGRDWFSAVDLI